MSRGLPRDGDDDDANDNNNNEEIDLVCHEEMNLSESDDNDDTHESNTSSSPDAYLQYRDYDSSLSNLFYKCNECILDEETELGLEKKGISKTTRFPYTLNHLALKEIFKRLLPLTQEKTSKLISTQFWRLLEVNVTRLMAKNLLFRIINREGEWIYSARSIVDIINTYNYNHKILLESPHVKLAPICCCVLQRRCIYATCCFYTWSVDATTHITNRYTHCCNGLYLQNCTYFESLGRHDLNESLARHNFHLSSKYTKNTKQTK